MHVAFHRDRCILKPDHKSCDYPSCLHISCKVWIRLSPQTKFKSLILSIPLSAWFQEPSSIRRDHTIFQFFAHTFIVIAMSVSYVLRSIVHSIPNLLSIAPHRMQQLSNSRSAFGLYIWAMPLPFLGLHKQLPWISWGIAIMSRQLKFFCVSLNHHWLCDLYLLLLPVSF